MKTIRRSTGARLAALSLVAAGGGFLAITYGCSSGPPSDCASHSNCTDAAADDGSVKDATGSEEIIVVGDGSNNDGAEGGPTCVAPTSLACGGTCVDPTQPAHCGNCENVCAGPDAGAGQATCTLAADGGGMCGLGCSGATSLDCNGACVDPTSPAHCGSCTNACAGPTTGTGSAVCTLGADGGGECSVSCTGATSEVCGGSCFAPTDPNHCGSCTNACAPPPSGNGQATCTGSTPTCGVSCTAGSHVCGGDCLANTDEPSDTADPCIVTEAFGVFVAPTGSDTTGTGTRTAPYATVGHAMDAAKTAGLARVYACGTAGNYTENLVVGSSRTGVTVYGGLNCTTSASTWSYVASDKATVAPASGYALQVTAAVTFEDFGFTSAAATTPGSSSIAVFVSGATGVVLDRCNMQAGTGAPGQDQAQPTPYTMAAPSGNPGGPSRTSGGTGAGGDAVANPSCSASIGGAGGSATTGELDGQSGQPGANNAGSSNDCNLLTPQGGGMGASVTTPGTAGAAASTWATFAATGWTATPGLPGGEGTAAQGGGGGGVVAVLNAAGGGGGGGAGGCGGAGGSGGTGGGSSIAVLVYNASVDLIACTLSAANAGPGGKGAPGQAGQAGGGFGAGNNLDDCNGGPGGTGGPGGPGGGGAGGLSAGVVWTGTAPTITAGSHTFGTLGAAGQNGDGTTTAKAGTAGAVVEFQ